MAWLNRWLACLPVQGEVHDYFRGVPAQVGEYLRTRACLLTSDGQLARPQECLLLPAPAPGVGSGSQTAIAPAGRFVELVSTHVDKHVVHPGLHVLYGNPALQ